MKRTARDHAEISDRRGFARLIHAASRRAGGVRAFAGESGIPEARLYDWLAQRRRGLTLESFTRLSAAILAAKLGTRLERCVQLPAAWELKGWRRPKPPGMKIEWTSEVSVKRTAWMSEGMARRMEGGRQTAREMVRKQQVIPAKSAAAVARYCRGEMTDFTGRVNAEDLRRLRDVGYVGPGRADEKAPWVDLTIPPNARLKAGEVTGRAARPASHTASGHRVNRRSRGHRRASGQ